MGLDNYIFIKRKSMPEKVYAATYGMTEKNWEKDYDIEVCYWRKCWNIRNFIFDVIEERTGAGCAPGNDNFEMTIDDIPPIIEKLAAYTEKTWEEDYDDCETIWEWDVYKDVLCKDCQALSELYQLMQDNPEIEIYFCDSY